MHIPKISVILPSLNVCTYIEECVDSVLGQTLQDIEIICVDAGSTDGTVEILKRYAADDPRVILLRSDIKSYGAQINLGVSRAHGTYVGIVDTDDYVLPEMYAYLYEAAEEKNADFVKSDFYRFKDIDGRRQKKLEKVPLNDAYYGKVLAPRHCKETFQFTMNTWNGIYKRSFLEKNDIRHNESPGASFQDNGFWFQTMMFAERAVFLDRAFYMNRRDNPNSSVYNKGKVFAGADEYQFIRSVLDRHPALKQQVWPQFVRAMVDSYEGTFVRIPPERWLEFLPRYAADFRELIKAGQIPYEVLSNERLGKLFRIAFDEERYTKFYFSRMTALYQKMTTEKRVIIYGAGKIARQFFDITVQYVPEAEILCFAVTSERGNDASYCGVDIREISELDAYKDELFVVAMGRRYRDAVVKQLNDMGFQRVERLPLIDDVAYKTEDEIRS